MRGGRGFGEEGGEGGVEFWGTRGGGLRVGTSDSERELTERRRGGGADGAGAESTSSISSRLLGKTREKEKDAVPCRVPVPFLQEGFAL